MQGFAIPRCKLRYIPPKESPEFVSMQALAWTLVISNGEETVTDGLGLGFLLLLLLLLLLFYFIGDPVTI